MLCLALEITGAMPLHVLDGNLERRGLRTARSLRATRSIDSKMEGENPKRTTSAANASWSPRDQSGKYHQRTGRRCSPKTQMDRVHGIRHLAPLKHNVDFLRD